MIEANILIDRDLTIKGYKRAYGMQALRNGASFYSGRAFVVFLAVAIVDTLYGAGQVVSAHLYVLAALAVGASVYHYFDWLRKLSADARDHEFQVVLDDAGVTIKNENDKRIEWSAYAYFKEFEDYLEITDTAGDVSFLPKRDELADVIVFTKTKIPNKTGE